jgi:signal transduction histidine kinase
MAGELLLKVIPSLVAVACEQPCAELPSFEEGGELDEANRKLRRANDELKRLYATTKELDQLKSEVFANVSHELRTVETDGEVLGRGMLLHAQQRLCSLGGVARGKLAAGQLDYRMAFARSHESSSHGAAQLAGELGIFRAVQ